MLKHKVRMGLVGLAVMAVVGVLGAGLASASVDNQSNTISGCSQLSWADNQADGSSYVSIQKTGTCSQNICITLVYVAGGTAHYATEACVFAAAGIGATATSSSGGAGSGSYLGRKWRTGSNCQFDYWNTNPSPVGC